MFKARPLLILFLGFLLLTPAVSRAEETIEEAATLNLQAYAPARIVITYSYTQNFSVSDVSTLGRPEYKIISGPTSIEFKTAHTDTFTFTVEIKYPAILGQSIQIAVFSAGNPPEGIQINVKTSTVKLRFTLTITEEPSYPSAQDVAEQVVRQVANELTLFKQDTKQIIDVQNRNLETQWILVLINLAINSSLLVTLTMWKRREKEEG
ncbi:hypothetical protein CW705_02215 [Candidatus Bathyarchaeota archaeon]|nr:MAG: hypothetical protein CW705_02215 [Candidatus Bathyarchaeota archaeon]